ncbi:glycine/sarcosine/betaine reductase component B subunits family protein [Clostridioides difficile DA00189]|nr:glycine/sarcosine/betaine reductase component B subunit [Clostridioides difficile]EQG91227.1 glycine/sarcosine/betaine reductase component B subunits family protein [Clostridioides difficile DA00189]
MEEKIMRRLVIKPFHMNEVNFGSKTSIKKDVLTIDLSSIDEIKEREELITDIKVDIIKPEIMTEKLILLWTLYQYQQKF